MRVFALAVFVATCHRAPLGPPLAKSDASASTISFSIDWRARPKRISPWIYGAAYDPMKIDDRAWKMGISMRRWGGNTTSRYNWESKNAWNSGSDWFFENAETKPYTDFLSENAAHKGASALSVPMIGWVAKDTTSYSFPVSVFGRQAKFDEGKKDAGNGNAPDGKAIAPGPPARTTPTQKPPSSDCVRRAGFGIRRTPTSPGSKSR